MHLSGSKSRRSPEETPAPDPLERLGVISHRSAQEAIGPFLGELARAGKDHGHLGVADGQASQHFRKPRTAAGLSSKQVRVITFDHNRRPWELAQALQLEGQAAIREGGSKVLERLALECRHYGTALDRGVVSCRERSPLDHQFAIGELPTVLLTSVDGDGYGACRAAARDSGSGVGRLCGLL